MRLKLTSMESEQINLLKVGTKAQSKYELYRALVVEGGMYLPPEKETSMFFISQIVIGDKKVASFVEFVRNIILIGTL